MRRTNRFAIALVAAGSLALTACGGGSEDTGTTPPADTGAENEVVLNGTIQLKFDPTTASADAGTVTFTLASEGVVHNVVVEGVNDDAVIVEAEAGQTASGTVDLEAGTYTYFCNVAGHREAGMEGTLTVS